VKGHDLIMVICCAVTCLAEGNPAAALGTVLTNARLHDDLTCHAKPAGLMVLPAVSPGQIPPTDFGHAGRPAHMTKSPAAGSGPAPVQEAQRSHDSVG
jgi:hypothetical protein